MTIENLEATSYTGQAELWLDPLGNEVLASDCTLNITGGAVRYTWSYEGKAQSGSVTPNDSGAVFTDSWHQPKPMPCATVPNSWALLDVQGTYGAGEGPDWGWAITLSQRPSGEVVLQMTNVAPWGEHGRAVRMVCTPS